MTTALKAEEREFLVLVLDASAANPFSNERSRIDAVIAGDGSALATPEVRLEAAIRKVSTFLNSLKKSGRCAINTYQDQDRQLVEGAHLFEVFHRFLDPFDRLIQRQTETGDGTCPVPFARDVLTDLASRGFPDEACQRYLALFYQLRRAFFFIRSSLVGSCDSMRKLRCDLWANVFTMDINTYARHLWNRMEDFSTLLLGETGTGKGAAAAAIGRSGFIPYDTKRGCFSESFVKSFVPINLSQFSEALIESELFGHRKGAFTGAIEAHEGVFALCSPHGAIFLDEIGDVSIPTQIKLLKVLQERTFSPVGSHETRRFQGRVIAASNRDIQGLRDAGEFRDDFYYRLCSDAITVPPLRTRIDEDSNELRLLIDFIVSRILGERSSTVATTVAEVITRDLGNEYAWPGNVRELEQRTRQVLLRRHCSPDMGKAHGKLDEALELGLINGTLTVDELTAGYCTRLHRDLGTYEAVAKRTGLDRRTVKKYVSLCVLRAARHESCPEQEAGPPASPATRIRR